MTPRVTQPDRVVVYEFELDPSEVAHALWVSEEAALEELRDGRVASRWAEHWGAQIGKVIKSKNSNQKSFDLSAIVSDISIQVSSKCLTGRGVKFQNSSFTGPGRKCTPKDLLDSLSNTDLVQVVDITSVPKIRLVTIRARDLAQEARAGNLTYTGWTRKKFYDFLVRVYKPELVQLARDGRRPRRFPGHSDVVGLPGWLTKHCLPLPRLSQHRSKAAVALQRS